MYIVISQPKQTEYNGMIKYCICVSVCLQCQKYGSEIGWPFFEDRIFYRLLIAIPMKTSRKFGRPKWILVSQMLKLVGKWPMADLFLALACVCMYVCVQLYLCKVVLGNIPVISLHQGIGFIPVTLLRIPFYRYFINYIFLWLRGGHEVVNK